jgi:prolyl-tRNA synthetase
LCDACGYAANRQIARFKKAAAASEAPQPAQKVATPDTKTIEDLANLLSVPKAKTAKAVFQVAAIPQGKEVVERFVFAVVRGDMEVNETKLANAVGAQSLRPARVQRLSAWGSAGYALPWG